MRIVVGVIAIALAVSAGAQVELHRGSTVYVVTGHLSDGHAGWSPDAELRQTVERNFKKETRLRLVSTLSPADVVFVMVLDARSAKIVEIGLALAPSDFSAHVGNLDAMRKLAIWQAQMPLHPTADAWLAIGTAGVFRRQDRCWALVQQFLTEELGE